MDLLEGYRLLVEAAGAGADVSGLAEEFNRALAVNGSLGPGFAVLAERLVEAARWASFVRMVELVVAVVASVVLGVLLFRFRRVVLGRVWLWV